VKLSKEAKELRKAYLSKVKLEEQIPQKRYDGLCHSSWDLRWIAQKEPWKLV
jgi:hypothetical protein